jgi:hypothetical protein
MKLDARVKRLLIDQQLLLSTRFPPVKFDFAALHCQLLARVNTSCQWNDKKDC